MRGLLVMCPTDVFGGRPPPVAQAPNWQRRLLLAFPLRGPHRIFPLTLRRPRLAADSDFAGRLGLGLGLWNFLISMRSCPLAASLGSFPSESCSQQCRL